MCTHTHTHIQTDGDYTKRAVETLRDHTLKNSFANDNGQNGFRNIALSQTKCHTRLQAFLPLLITQVLDTQPSSLSNWDHRKAHIISHLILSALVATEMHVSDFFFTMYTEKQEGIMWCLQLSTERLPCRQLLPKVVTANVSFFNLRAQYWTKFLPTRCSFIFKLSVLRYRLQTKFPQGKCPLVQKITLWGKSQTREHERHKHQCQQIFSNSQSYIFPNRQSPSDAQRTLPQLSRTAMTAQLTCGRIWDCGMEPGNVREGQRHTTDQLIASRESCLSKAAPEPLQGGKQMTNTGLQVQSDYFFPNCASTNMF